MTSDKITINGESYSLTEAPPADLPPFEASVLEFCRNWQAGQPSITLQTSGSTGEPKPITLRREQMIASASATGTALKLQPGDRALVCLSVDYIAGLMMLVRGLELGLQLTVIPPASDPLAGFAPETRFEFTALVPLQLQTALRQSAEKIAILNGMKAILLGGAPVNAELLRQIQSINAPIYHTYGMTETATHIALRRLNGPAATDAFTPLPGVSPGLDGRGCLTIRAAVTNGETLTTNDRVELRPDGSFVWLGRFDNVINSGGVKVQAEKVEAALEKHLTGRRVCVVPAADDRLGQMVVAVIEGDPLTPAAEIEIRTSLAQSLTRFEIPRRFVYLPRLPQTSSGKIDRQTVAQTVANR